MGYLFARGFTGSVLDQGGNWAVNVGGVECWTKEGLPCPLVLTADSSWPVCGDGLCEPGETVCSCSSDCGLPPLEICSDGIDNDCDDAIGCEDSDCALDEICYVDPVTVPGECELSGATCDIGGDCCSGHCRTSGQRAGTCR